MCVCMNPKIMRSLPHQFWWLVRLVTALGHIVKPNGYPSSWPMASEVVSRLDHSSQLPVLRESFNSGGQGGTPAIVSRLILGPASDSDEGDLSLRLRLDLAFPRLARRVGRDTNSGEEEVSSLTLSAREWYSTCRPRVKCGGAIARCGVSCVGVRNGFLLGEPDRFGPRKRQLGSSAPICVPAFAVTESRIARSR